MTEYGLSADPEMGMTKAEAANFIAMYLNRFPGVKAYADDQIAFARANGYVSTMFGHRRPVPSIRNTNPWIRKSAENICMNTPIQGSAADIIRKAMLDIQREKPAYFTTVMQIHDELEGLVPVEHAIEGAMFLQNVMERPIPGFSEIMPISAEPWAAKIWGHALDIKFKADGTPYVKPKAKKKDATDVTYDMIDYALPLYKLAGIEVV